MYVIRLFVVFLLLTVITNVARATDGIEHSSERHLTGTLGGSGGEWLRTECDDGLYLAGFQVRYGNWIDAIGINCATAVNHSGVGRLDNPGSTQILLWGGQGGGVGNLLCNPDEAVQGIRVQRSPNNFVGFIGVRCTLLNDPGGRVRNNTPDFGRISDKSPPAQDIDCPIGMIGIGIHGATGNAVDRLGLVCAPAPKFYDQPKVSDQLKHSDGIAGTIKRPIDPNSEITQGAGAPISNLLSHCKAGFVPRQANASDQVCVEQQSRDRVAQENAGAAALVDPNGAWGPQSCISGFVWREAFDGDTVCVTPEVREIVREENRSAASREK
jgi:hypothetical protein